MCTTLAHINLPHCMQAAETLAAELRTALAAPRRPHTPVATLSHDAAASAQNLLETSEAAGRAHAAESAADVVAEVAAAEAAGAAAAATEGQAAALSALEQQLEV